MSHFIVMVIGENPEDQLAPYNENIEVEEYKREVLLEKDKKSFMDYYTESCKEVLPRQRKENKKLSFDQLYEVYGNRWNGNRWKKDENGDWANYSTYNPKSKWDWYQLGGRWSGQIKLKEEKKGEAGVFKNEVGIDRAKKGNIVNLDEILSFAVVKDGKWYERGECGWFGSVKDEKDEEDWKKEIKELLEDVPEDTLISMYDCHI